MVKSGRYEIALLNVKKVPPDGQQSSWTLMVNSFNYRCDTPVIRTNKICRAALSS